MATVLCLLHRAKKANNRYVLVDVLEMPSSNVSAPSLDDFEEPLSRQNDICFVS